MKWKMTAIGGIFTTSTILTIFLCGYTEFNYSHLWWGEPLAITIIALWIFISAGLLVYFMKVLDDY